VSVLNWKDVPSQLRTRANANIRRAVGLTQNPPPRCVDPDTAYFPIDGVARLVHADLSSMLVGGIASLFFQMLHPHAMAALPSILATSTTHSAVSCRPPTSLAPQLSGPKKPRTPRSNGFTRCTSAFAVSLTMACLRRERSPLARLGPRRRGFHVPSRLPAIRQVRYHAR